MRIPEPKIGEITVYSKSGCSGCVNVKKLLNKLFDNIIIIDCDEFILEDKETFLQFIKEISGKECKTFPIVFDSKTFIGCYKETISYLDKLLVFDLTF